MIGGIVASGSLMLAERVIPPGGGMRFHFARGLRGLAAGDAPGRGVGDAAGSCPSAGSQATPPEVAFDPLAMCRPSFGQIIFPIASRIPADLAGLVG